MPKEFGIDDDYPLSDKALKNLLRDMYALERLCADLKPIKVHVVKLDNKPCNLSFDKLMEQWK